MNEIEFLKISASNCIISIKYALKYFHWSHFHFSYKNSWFKCQTEAIQWVNFNVNCKNIIHQIWVSPWNPLSKGKMLSIGLWDQIDSLPNHCLKVIQVDIWFGYRCHSDIQFDSSMFLNKVASALFRKRMIGKIKAHLLNSLSY